MKRLIISHEMSYKHLQYLKRSYIKNPKVKYHDSLYSRLKNFQPDRDEMLKGISKKSIELIVSFLINNYEKIILSKPEKLLRIEEEFYNLVRNEGIDSAICMKKINNFLKYIFDYKKFSKTENSYWNPIEFTKNLNINVCPICNAQYTFTQKVMNIEKRIKFKIRPDLDHFFVQSKHPMLALSIYNLVPSCSICNSKLKGNKDGSLDNNIHPYLECLDELAFFKRIISKSNEEIDAYSQILGFNNEYKFELVAKDEKNSEKVEGFESMYRLTTRYDLYRDVISRGIKKSLLYTDTYKLSLDQAYSFLDKQKLNREFYNNDLNNNLLSKVGNDIFTYELLPILSNQKDKG